MSSFADSTTLAQDDSREGAVVTAIPTTATATAVSGTALTPLDVDEWRSRIRSKQKSAASSSCSYTNGPHSKIQQVRELQEQSARAQKSAKQAKRLERSNMLNMQCSSIALNAYASAPARSSSITSRAYDEVSDRMTRFAGAIQRSALATPRLDTPPAEERMSNRSAAAIEEGEDEEADLDALESELKEYAAEQSTASPAPAPAAVLGSFGFAEMDDVTRRRTTEAVGSELTKLLRQLEREPSDAAECTAKFKLFEDFLATVTTIRDQTLAFWSDNKDQFTGPSRASGDRDIRNIDSSDAMGIVDDPTRWFVYFMALKANQNSTAISGVLASLRSRLEQLSSQLGDCPFCLEPMTPDACTLLSCAHRSCTGCWTHWVAMKGPEAAFCPICRHAEFEEEIAI